ncbi:MAG: VCBS repeat-containing protein, partial [Caldilineaceae bacterium]|nr:VCBS repeat-containing protein [Caldilineaceae bacterium]
MLGIEAGGTYWDVDGDGDLDIVMGNDYSGNQVWWWENPAPNFSPTTDWQRRLIKNSGDNQHHDMVFDDFTGDGKAELVFWNQQAEALFLAEIPNNPRTTQPWSAVQIYSWSGGASHEGIDKADINGDGQIDIVGGGRWFEHVSGNQFQVHVIDNAQRFGRAVAGQLIPGGYAEVVLGPGDNSNSLEWYRWNNATNQWQSTTLIPSVERGHSLQIIDFDQDGHLDIFMAEMRLNGGNNNAIMVLFRGDGTGNFERIELASGFGNHQSKVADLDGDGDLDILGKPYNWQTPRLDIWLNQQNPVACTPKLDQWQRHVVDNDQRWRAVFVDSSDINGDGHIDIITGADWYQNPGTVDGNWTRHRVGAPMNNMAAVYDFDGDGDVDILGTEGSNSVYNHDFQWAKNNGSGSFTIHNNVEAGDGDFLQGVAVGRFMDDMQVALSWHAADKGVQLLTLPGNPTAGTWTRSLASSVSQDEQLTVGDLDGDGDLDLVQGTKWLRNNSATNSGWHDSDRGYRISLAVSADGYARTEHPAEASLNFTNLLASLGGGAVGSDSLNVIEVDTAGNLIADNPPFQFDAASGYDANTNAAGSLTILMTGATAANATRYYQVYFAPPSSNYTPISTPDQVVVSDGTDEGMDTFTVAVNGATYFYQKEAGGFSSLVDADGNDWISYNNASGAAGEYRGIPNLVYPEGNFHPGDSGSESTLVADGPLKATIHTVTDDNTWQATWEIFPGFARMTLEQAGHNYWFLYEGTPGGVLEPDDDLVVRADGTNTSAGTAWTGDLEPEEWAYFGDPAVGNDGRALFVAKHTNDTAIDSYYAMNGQMTVFGNGRQNTQTHLSNTPEQFTIGLLETVEYATAAPVIRSAYRPLLVTMGGSEEQTAPTGGTWEEMTLSNVSGLPDRNRLGDVNGDGRLDVVIGYEPASGSQERVAWYAQPANITDEWTEYVIDTITRPLSLDVQDMDGDGDLDVIVGEHHPNNPSGLRMLIYENVNGNGSAWNRFVVYTGDEHHDGAHVVDIDDDGDLDIVSIGWINDKVVVYENLSDCAPVGGTPTPAPTATPGGSGNTPTPTPLPTQEATPTPETTMEPSADPCDGAATNMIRNPSF